MSFEDLTNVTESKDKADNIWGVSELVRDYSHFKSMLDTGFTFGINDFQFDKVVMFSWIKESINERKTRV